MIRQSWGTLGLGLLLVAGCGPGEPMGPASDREVPGGQESLEAAELAGEGASEAIEPLERQAVTLYFPSAFADGLVPEEAEIFETASPVDRAKQILSDLISGPAEDYALDCLPPSTRLRQVYVTDSGVAYADFTRELTQAIGGGSSREILTVYAIVDSLALNIPEIGRVGILVEGRPIKTLNGHLDLSRPLPPNMSLIEEPGAREKPERAEHRIVQLQKGDRFISSEE